MKNDVNHDPKELNPAFRVKCLATIEQANRETKGKFAGFVRWTLFEGYRTPERQAELYAQGRTAPGNIVTHLHHSKHQDRNAADIVWIDSHGSPRWDGPDRLWQILGHCARANDLEWGGDWETFKDTPHIQEKGA